MSDTLSQVSNISGRFDVVSLLSNPGEALRLQRVQTTLFAKTILNMLGERQHVALLRKNANEYNMIISTIYNHGDSQLLKDFIGFKKPKYAD